MVYPPVTVISSSLPQNDDIRDMKAIFGSDRWKKIMPLFDKEGDEHPALKRYYFLRFLAIQIRRGHWQKKAPP
jgi:hypothetical protein